MLKKSKVFSKKLSPLFLFFSYVAPISLLHAASTPAKQPESAASLTSSVNSVSSKNDNLNLVASTDLLKSSVKNEQNTSLKDSSTNDASKNSQALSDSRNNRKFISKNSRKKVYKITVEEDFLEPSVNKNSKETFKRQTKMKNQAKPDVQLSKEPDINPCFCCKKLLQLLEWKEHSQYSNVTLERSDYFDEDLKQYRETEENYPKNLLNREQEGLKNLKDQDMNIDERWELHAGDDQTLLNNLQEWCDKAHWTLVWKASCDYPIEANAVFSGSFPNAVSSLIDAYKDAELPLRANIYSKQKLVVISLF